MIFKTFDSDKNTFSSKFGILGKSFEDIENRFKKVSDELIATNDYTISNIANAWKNSSVKKDLSDKFIITKSDVQDKLKDLSVYEQNPDDILNGLLTQKKLVEANQSSWQDYFNGLKEGERWQVKFVQENDLTKVSLDDVKNAQNAAKQSAIAYNNGLEQMTIGAKAANVAMKGLAIAGNMLLSIGISFVISEGIKLIDNYIHRVDNAKDALEEFNSSVKEQKDNFSTQESWINENGKRFEELSQGVDKFGHNISLTTDEFSEYKDMTSKIAEMFPTMIKGYNDQNDVILKNKGSVDELTEAYKKNQEAYYADIRSKSGDSFDNFKTAISGDKKNAEILGKIIDGNSIQYGLKLDGKDVYNNLKEVLDDEALKELNKQTPFNLSDGKNTYTFDDLTPELQQKIRDTYETLNSTIATESEKVKPILEAYLDTNTSGYDKLSDEAKTDVQLFINNLNGAFMDSFESDTAMEEWVRKNVIAPLKDGIDSDDLGGMTVNLLGGKTENESIGDYEKRISTAISDIKAYCKKNKIEIPFNLDAIKSEADEVKATAKSVVEDIEKNVIKNGSGSASDIDTITNWVNSLTQDELKYAQSDEFQKALVAKQQELGRTSLAASEYKDVLESVKKTESNTVDTLGGTLDSVKKAFESDNASTDWTSLAGYLKQAKELYDGGFIGTDDFQSVAQWMSPDKIDTSQYEISANAYVDAWKNAYDKVSRWFDSEDETASIWNFLEDLKTADSSLVDIDKDTGKVQTHFSSTAEVAKALGVNVEVVETMLKTMSDYGFQLDGVEDSAQELEQVKTDLASVQALYDNMQDGSRKDRLGELLKNWNTQVDGFQQDMSTMQQGFDIPIKFEYDIQQIYDQIDQIRSKMANGGKESRNDYANLLGLNDQAISKLEDHTGTDDVTNEYLEKYQEAIEKKSKAISKAVKDGKDGNNDSEIIAAQKELDKKQQEYEKLLQQFNDWGTKNNIDFDNASAEDFQNYWNDFFSQPHELEIDAKVKNKEDIENLLEDASENSTITFTANVDGVEQQITAIKNEDGTITYYGDVSDPETQVYYVKDQDGMIYFSGDTTEAVNNVIQTQQNVENSSSSFTVGADTSPAENSANSLLAAISQGKASVTVDGNLSPFQKAWNSVAGFLNKLGGNVPTFSTTHSGGGHSISGSSGKISGNSRASVLANKERALNSQMRGGSSTRNTFPSYVNSSKRNTGAGNLRGNLISPSSKKPDKSSGKSGGGSGGGSAQKEPTKKDYDWIETLISRINRQVTNLGKTVSATYKTWSTRNNALAQELGSVNQQISAEQQAYNKYMQLANSVGLPEGYASLVRNGTIDVSTIQDDDLNDKIEKYKSYYESALSAADAVQDLQDKLAELAKTRFDNISSDFESQIDQIKHSTTMYQSYIDQVEAEDAIPVRSYYENMIANEQQTISRLKDEYSQLTNTMNEALNTGRIQAYSEEWYNMRASINSVDEAIQDANKSIIEYTKSMKELSKTKFNKISTAYENASGFNDHAKNMYNGLIDQADAEGRFASKDYYSALMDMEKLNIKTLTQESNDLHKSLQDAMNKGDIEEYSDDWYEMMGKINDVDEAIMDANKSLTEYGNSMRQLDWDLFDKQEEYISKIQEESDFLVDLMSNQKLYDDDTGKDTKYATAIKGLHVVNYDVYKAQAQDYAKEIEKINKDLADDPNNMKLIERKQELIKAQQDAISNAEQEKQAIKSLVKDGIDAQLDALQKLIDKYKDSLQATKDLYDYEKNVKEQTDSLAALQKQRQALGGDNSEETQSKIQQLDQQIKDAKSNLEDTEYQQYLSDQEQLLDTFYDETEEWLNARLDDLDGLIQQVIEDTNANSGNIAQTITDTTNGVGYTLTGAMATIWGTTDTNLTNNLGSVSNNITGAIGTIGSGLQNIGANTNNAVNGIKGLVQQLVDDAKKRAAEEAARKAAEAAKKAAEEAKKKAEEAAKQKTPTVPTGGTPSGGGGNNGGGNPSGGGSSSGGSSGGGNGAWGSWFIHQADSYPKNRLDVNKQNCSL